jgi:hypothetical protein
MSTVYFENMFIIIEGKGDWRTVNGWVDDVQVID